MNDNSAVLERKIKDYIKTRFNNAYNKLSEMWVLEYGESIIIDLGKFTDHKITHYFSIDIKEVIKDAARELADEMEKKAKSVGKELDSEYEKTVRAVLENRHHCDTIIFVNSSIIRSKEYPKITLEDCSFLSYKLVFIGRFEDVHLKNIEASEIVLDNFTGNFSDIHGIARDNYYRKISVANSFVDNLFIDSDVKLGSLYSSHSIISSMELVGTIIIDFRYTEVGTVNTDLFKSAGLVDVKNSSFGYYDGKNGNESICTDNIDDYRYILATMFNPENPEDGMEVIMYNEYEDEDEHHPNKEIRLIKKGD